MQQQVRSTPFVEQSCRCCTEGGGNDRCSVSPRVIEIYWGYVILDQRSFFFNISANRSYRFCIPITYPSDGYISCAECRADGALQIVLEHKPASPAENLESHRLLVWLQHPQAVKEVENRPARSLRVVFSFAPGSVLQQHKKRHTKSTPTRRGRGSGCLVFLTCCAIRKSSINWKYRKKKLGGSQLICFARRSAHSSSSAVRLLTMTAVS